MTQKGNVIPIALVDKLLSILNKLVRQAESFGLNKTQELCDKSVGQYLYENYLELIEKEVKTEFVGDKLSEKEFTQIVDGFFIWRFSLNLIY